MNTEDELIREILFHGFHKHEDGAETICVEGEIVNGRWIEGFPVNLKHNDGKTHVSSFIIPLGVDMNCGTLLETVLVPVITLTMDQFTGLNDQTGKHIFGGAICRDSKGDLVQILWSPKHQWGAKILKSTYALSFGLTFPLWQYDHCKENGYRTLEVIGTVFDTPPIAERDSAWK